MAIGTSHTDSIEKNTWWPAQHNTHALVGKKSKALDTLLQSSKRIWGQLRGKRSCIIPRIKGAKPKKALLYPDFCYSYDTAVYSAVSVSYIGIHLLY